jgi:hypothetical protein
MRYIDVNWAHESEKYPYRLISEIGNNQFEVRKLEFFRNGKIGFASGVSNTENTMLGIVEVSPLEEINSDNEFQGKNISKQEFELIWQKYVPVSS